ncbi:lantibiotic immunity ABC transporter MutG family permease subunit [Streptococcus sobrinus]|uniref:lantibiotic immunity ABC transporter MutG family permease subunit n=1 Tax=Streptococcus sobrinus TaxID=1310 RepID=UPI00037306B1|nr:lantibiotic immunity ABC transporter MutG family permease subunit [Streptococcus sobrinus]
MIGLLKAENIKYRHTFLPWLHLILPITIAVFVTIYGLLTPAYSWYGITSGYLELLGISFPIVSAIICGKSVGLEAEAGQFQVILAIKQRKLIFCIKLLNLLILEVFSTILAIGIYGLIYQLNNNHLIFYGYAVILLTTSTIILYLVHLVVAFLFGNGASIGLGITESLLSALLLTGLGDGIWQFIPCAWGTRLMDTLINLWRYPEHSLLLKQQILIWLAVAVPLTLIVLIFSIIWFDRWQGRSNAE